MMPHYSLPPIQEEQRPMCAAGCGFHAAIEYDDVPICLADISDFYDELTGEQLADWARQRAIKRGRKSQ